MGHPVVQSGAVLGIRGRALFPYMGVGPRTRGQGEGTRRNGERSQEIVVSKFIRIYIIPGVGHFLNEEDIELICQTFSLIKTW